VLPGGIPVQWIVQGGAVGLLGFVALLVFLGQLIPRSSYKQLERDRDYWRAAALKAIGHTEQLLPAAKITTEVTKAFADATSNAVQKALGGEREGPPA
jgi:hypothetical protein